MPAAPAFPTPATIEALVARTLADAEYDALDALELKAAAERLFWNHGSVTRAIGDHTDPQARGPGYWGLLTFGAAQREVSRPDLIAARHERAAASIDGQVAGREVTIAEKERRIAALREQDAQPRDWLTQNWPDNSAEIRRLEDQIDAHRASLPVLRAEAEALRTRAAELLTFKAAA